MFDVESIKIGWIIMILYYSIMLKSVNKRHKFIQINQSTLRKVIEHFDYKIKIKYQINAVIAVYFGDIFKLSF